MIIGIDLGGSKIEVGLINHQFEVVAKARTLTKAKAGPKAIISQLCQLIDQMDKASPDQITGLGVGVPGEIPPLSGLVLSAPNLGWVNLPLKEILTQRYNWPIAIDNDVNCSALAESKLGLGNGKESLIFIAVGTGIGGGIVLNRQLMRGQNGSAGEIGHMIMLNGGPKCSCGNYGCLEALASGTAIIRQVKNHLKRKIPSIIPQLVKDRLEDIDVSLIAQANEMGDSLSHKILNKAGHYLGLGVANLINILNPQIVVLDGGVIKAAPSLIELIRNTAKQRTLKAAQDNLEIAPSSLNGQAGIIGAALLLANEIP